MPDNKRRQHFVPQFYLRRFSFDEKSINLYNIKSGKTILGGKLKTQCFRDYLYGKDLTFEHHLGEIEKAASVVLRRLDETGFFPKRMSKEWTDILMFVIFQHSRTSAAITDLDALVDAVSKNMMSRHPTLKEYDQSKFNIRMKGSPQFSVSLGIMTLPLASDLGLKLLRSPSPDAFITSDNPVIYYNRLLEDNSFHSHCGIASKGLLVFLPISHQTILCLYDEKTYNFGSSKEESLLVMKSDDVEQLNCLQFVSADRNIYFRGGLPRSIPEDMERFRRNERTKTKTFHDQDNSGGELLATSRQDIRINLSLSFVRLTKHAKAFQRTYMSASSHPAIIPRNPALLEGHRIFMDQIEKERREKAGSDPR